MPLQVNRPSQTPLEPPEPPDPQKMLSKVLAGVTVVVFIICLESPISLLAPSSSYNALTDNEDREIKEIQDRT